MIRAKPGINPFFTSNPYDLSAHSASDIAKLYTALSNSLSECPKGVPNSAESLPMLTHAFFSKRLSFISQRTAKECTITQRKKDNSMHPVRVPKILIFSRCDVQKPDCYRRSGFYVTALAPFCVSLFLFKCHSCTIHTVPESRRFRAIIKNVTQMTAAYAA